MKAQNIGRRAAVLLAAMGLVLGATACEGETPDDQTCVAELGGGELVITEIMNNPDGSDDGYEWFEVYNVTGETIDLEGLRLVTSRADGSNRKEHILPAGWSIAPSEYLVFGGVLEIAMPPYMDVPFADHLGDLPNAGGALALECGDTRVDRVIYVEANDGIAQVFDGSLVPDSVGNDNLADWCEAKSPYWQDNFGTPGTANTTCGAVTFLTCLDGSVERDILPPQPGDVVITELMPNPHGTPPDNSILDSDGEWVEIYFAEAADLNGLELGKDGNDIRSTLAATACVSVQAGDYVLFAINTNPAENGNLPAVVGELGFSLTNGGGTLMVGYGGVVYDEILWTGSSQGKSISLDSGHIDPVENDDATNNWCDGVGDYGNGDEGTPGAQNDACSGTPQDICLEGGNPRPIVRPVVGDLVITEVMPNSGAVLDGVGEWFEVLVTADVDLNGLEFGDTGIDETLPGGGDCLRFTAGSYVLFAKETISASNGGLPPVDFLFSFSIGNSSLPKPLFVGIGGAVLDAITYLEAPSGVAMQLDPAHLDAVENDDASANWCRATSAYGAGDLGTPGFVNDATCL